jgi:glycosyltransferase involved in cell wall biosynthesis
MKKVLFIFDRVAHYHEELFKTLEQALPSSGLDLYLLSGKASQSGKGRVGLDKPVIAREYKYAFREHKVSSFILRRHIGVKERLAELQPDIVVLLSHVGNISHWDLMRLKKKLGFKLVAWQCGYEYNPGALKDYLLGKFIPQFDHHLAYHSNAREYAIRYGARPDQVTVMHNTINEEKIAILPKAEARALVVDKHPEIGDRKIILFVGAVLAEKRIEVILQALDLMHRRDVVLVLVGDGGHLPVIRQLCAGRDDVVPAGSIVQGVGPYFDAAEMYVLPGTGGLGINEAMAHRLPIVSGYADGSADDLVIDGENGYRLRQVRPQELAEKMTLILEDPALTQRMGERSRQMITGKFAFREFIKRIVNELTRLAQ